MCVENEMIAAWKEAARDLGIVVVAPFPFGKVVLPVLVTHFGSPKATTPMLIGVEDLVDAAKNAGFCVSLLNGESYGKYERGLFVDTLNDWGWFGTGEPPHWYTGQPWS